MFPRLEVVLVVVGPLIFPQRLNARPDYNTVSYPYHSTLQCSIIHMQSSVYLNITIHSIIITYHTISHVTRRQVTCAGICIGAHNQGVIFKLTSLVYTFF